MFRTHSRSLHFCYCHPYYSSLSSLTRRDVARIAPNSTQFVAKSTQTQWNLSQSYLRCHCMSKTDSNSSQPRLKSTPTHRKCLSTALTSLDLSPIVFNSSQMPLNWPNVSSFVSNYVQLVPTSLSRVDRNWCHSVPTSQSKVHLRIKGLLVIRLAIALGEWTL